MFCSKIEEYCQVVVAGHIAGILIYVLKKHSKAYQPYEILLRTYFLHQFTINELTHHLSLFSFRYLRLYGRKFSKDDHVLFIKLLYELVTIPKLEISMMQGFARLLINLLK